MLKEMLLCGEVKLAPFATPICAHITHIPITQRMFLFQMNKLLDKQYIKLYNFTPADCVCKPLDYPDPHP